MNNPQVFALRNSLLTSCSRLFQDLGLWSLLDASPKRGQRQNSLSSDGSSERYIQERECIIPEQHAQNFTSILSDLLGVIEDLQQSEQRGYPAAGLSSRTVASSRAWSDYYTALQKRVARLLLRWNEIIPEATRHSARLTTVHQDEAIHKILHAVKSNNMRQFNETHFDWENSRHPVFTSARASPQSGDSPLEVPRPSLKLKSVRGVSGVIYQSRAVRLCTSEEVESTYRRNEKTLEAKRKEISRSSARVQTLPLDYMKGVLRRRLETGVVEPAEPLPLELISEEPPKIHEEYSVAQWFRGIQDPGSRRPLHISLPTQMDDTSMGTPQTSRRPSISNRDKPLPPTPSSSAATQSDNDSQKSAMSLKGSSARSSALGRSNSSYVASPANTSSSHWGTESRSRYSSHDSMASGDTAHRSRASSIEMAGSQESRATSVRSAPRPEKAPQGSHGHTDQPGTTINTRRSVRMKAAGYVEATNPRTTLRSQARRRVDGSSFWEGGQGTSVSRISRPQNPHAGQIWYSSPGGTQQWTIVTRPTNSSTSDYQYQGLQEDAEIRKARLRAKAERLGGRTISRRVTVNADRENKRRRRDCNCCCCCPCARRRAYAPYI